MTFGERLKHTRLAMNLSQTELAERSGISERSLYTYEQNGIIPRTNNIIRLAEALNVSVNYLMDQEDESQSAEVNEERRRPRFYPVPQRCLRAASWMRRQRRCFFSRSWRRTGNPKRQRAPSFPLRPV